MIAAYPDLNGFVGEADPPAITPREEADVAGRAAYDAAEALAILLDRDDGEYGERPEILDSIIARLVTMADEVRAALDPLRDPCSARLWDINPGKSCPVCGAAPDTKCRRAPKP